MATAPGVGIIHEGKTGNRDSPSHWLLTMALLTKGRSRCGGNRGPLLDPPAMRRMHTWDQLLQGWVTGRSGRWVTDGSQAGHRPFMCVCFGGKLSWHLLPNHPTLPSGAHPEVSAFTQHCGDPHPAGLEQQTREPESSVGASSACQEPPQRWG